MENTETKSIEQLEKENAEQTKIIQDATEAANALLEKKNKSTKKNNVLDDKKENKTKTKKPRKSRTVIEVKEDIDKDFEEKENQNKEENKKSVETKEDKKQKLLDLISEQRTKILEAIDKTSILKFSKLGNLKKLLWQLEDIRDSINIDAQETPRIGTKSINEVSEDFDVKSLRDINKLTDEYETMLNEDAGGEKIDSENKDQNNIDNKIKVGDTVEFDTKNPDTITKIDPETDKDPDFETKEHDEYEEEKSEKVNGRKIEKIITSSTGAAPVIVYENENKEEGEPGHISPEQIKTFEQVLVEKEAELKSKLESSKFEGSIIRGLSKWEKYGQGESGPKGFAKRMTKVGINLALVGLISSISVEKLAENGIGTASSLAGGVFSKLAMKMGVGLGMGASMDIIGRGGASDKVKKWIPKVVGGVFVGAAFLSPAGLAAGATAGGAFALGLLSQKFIKGKFTDEKIAEREMEAKAKFIEKLKIENKNIDENTIKETEADFTKIFNKYKRQRIWGKLLDGASKLTVGALISGIALEVSGEVHDHMTTHHTADTSIKHEGDNTHKQVEVKNQSEVKPIVDTKHETVSVKDSTEVKHEVEIKNIEHKDSTEVKTHDQIKTENNTNPLHLKTIDDFKHEAEVKAQAEADAKAALDTNPAHHPKTPEDFRNDAKHEAEVKAQQETTNKENAEQIKVAMVGKGGSYERSFIHQIENNHQKAIELGYKGDLNDTKALHEFAGNKADEIARTHGIVDKDGSQLGISKANETAPLIKIENGHVTIEDTTSDGKVIGIHHEGDKFGDNILKNDYIIKHHEAINTTNIETHNDHITNTPHVGPNGEIETNGDGIINTPHVDPNSFYSEDPSTYLHHSDVIDTPHQHEAIDNNTVNHQSESDLKDINHHTDKSTQNETSESSKEVSQHVLSHHEIRHLERISNHNINKIFPNNYEDQNWHQAKNMNAYELYHLKPNEISNEFKPLYGYLHKLSEVTGIKPLPGDKMFLPQTNEQYIGDALKIAAETGKLDQVKL